MFVPDIGSRHSCRGRVQGNDAGRFTVLDNEDEALEYYISRKEHSLGSGVEEILCD